MAAAATAATPPATIRGPIRSPGTGGTRMRRRDGVTGAAVATAALAASGLGSVVVAFGLAVRGLAVFGLAAPAVFAAARGAGFVTRLRDLAGRDFRFFGGSAGGTAGGTSASAGGSGGASACPPGS
jgi:hypothetical protein